MIDYHLHTHLCGHASGKLDEYVREGEKAGLAEIGFADHFPLEVMEFKPAMPVTMKSRELPRYVEEVQQATQNASLPVKLGAEVDYLPGKTEKALEIIGQHPFDYIIGSVHFIGEWDCTHPFYRQEFERRSLEQVYQSYFELIRGTCRSGMFDIIGHADAVKKFGYRITPEQARPLYRETARVLAETGVCLEVNTAGLDAPAGEIYPERDLLRECIREGVEITVGSDAHDPGEVARHFDRAREILLEEGVSRLAVFNGRRRSFYQLKKAGE